MGAVAVSALGLVWYQAEIKAHEAEVVRQRAEHERLLKEETARYKAEAEHNKAEIAADRRRREEANRQATQARKAADEKRQAELRTRRQINVRQRIEALRLKAEDGDPESQYLFGWLTRFGLRALGDFNADGTARELLPLAAYPTLGENLSDKMSAVLFVDLPEIVRDEAAALRWFERAALQGHGAAQHEMAHDRTFRGPGDDQVEAYKWYLLSHTCYFDPEGMVRTTRRLGLDGQVRYDPLPPDSRHYVPPGLLNSLTPEQKAEAEKRAKAFRPKKEKP